MDETVTLKPSHWQFLGLTGIYVLLVMTAVFVVGSPVFLLLTLVVLLLFWLHDLEHYKKDHLQLRVRSRGNICVWQLNVETCYPECRMYYNRWCMVVKLKNSRFSRSIILTADRFEDSQAYATARYLLCRFEETSHVA